MGLFYINDNIDVEDRYDPIKFYSQTDGVFNMLNSYFIAELKKLPSIGTYTCLDERPDTVAHKVYGDTQFYWILMLYNDCYDIEDGIFSAGSTINYPSISNIERLMFTLTAKQRALE